MLGRRRNEHLQLGLRVHLAFSAGRIEPEHAQHELRGTTQHPDDRREDREERAHGCGNPEGNAFRMTECDSLRHELAEDDVEERQHEVCDQYGEDRREVVVQRVRQRRFAERTDAQRRQRDTELHRRDEARRIARDAQHVARAPVPLVVQLDDARPSCGDEAVLARDEERVQQDQNRDTEELEEERHAPTSGAFVLGMSPATN